MVTGAGANGGIGHAIALGYARAGASLAVSDIDVAGLDQTAGEIAAIGVPVLALRCNIANSADIESLFAAVDQRFGRLDVLVNVPFYFPRRVAAHEIALDDWQQMLSVNLTGYFLCIRAALIRMLACSGGSIINIGSNAGVSALGRGALPYSSAKAAVHQMTKELAVEYASRNIRVNALVPAQVLTPGLEHHLNDARFREVVLPRILAGLPIGRLLEPEEMVGPAIFLASDAAKAVTGVLLPVDGGNLALNAGGTPNCFADQST
ncbi:MAG: SDR family NAD(P)-dependent oxidoreductase [Candidatus Korobacteraceae bacterium]